MKTHRKWQNKSDVELTPWNPSNVNGKASRKLKIFIQVLRQLDVEKNAIACVRSDADITIKNEVTVSAASVVRLTFINAADLLTVDKNRKPEFVVCNHEQ